MKTKLLIFFVFLISLSFSQSNWFTVNPPDLTTFSWNNQQTSSYAVVNNIPVFTVPFQNPVQWSSLMRTLPTAPYTITLVFCPSGPTYGIWHFGITLQDASNKAVNMMMNMYNAPGQIFVYREGNAAHYIDFEGTAYGPGNVPAAQIRAFRIVDNGSLRTYLYSADAGTVWAPQFQEPSGSYISPTKWGIVGVNLQNAGPVSAAIYRMELTTP